MTWEGIGKLQRISCAGFQQSTISIRPHQPITTWDDSPRTSRYEKRHAETKI